VYSRLRERARSSATRGRHRIAGALVVFQIVLALSLLVQATLFGRGMATVRKPAAYVIPDRSIAMHMTIPAGRYRERPALHAYRRRLVSDSDAIPGVEGSGAVSNLPYSTSNSDSSFRIEGAPEPKPGESPGALRQVITAGYFDAMRQPVLRGRAFTANDGAG